jgi:hypothetical protein
MKVISVIEDEDVIKKIFKHLGLWDKKSRPLAKATGPPKIPGYGIDISTKRQICRYSISHIVTVDKSGDPKVATTIETVE